MLFEKIQLEADESIVKIVYKHWFVIAIHTLLSLLVGMLPLLVWGFMLLIEPSPETLKINLNNYHNEFYFFFFWWLLVTFFSLAYVYTNYYLDVWVITNHRIIVVEQISLFRRSVGSFRYERLQDITVEINGIIATFLNFGTVKATTASGTEAFHGNNLPDPREIKSLILKASDTKIDL